MGKISSLKLVCLGTFLVSFLLGNNVFGQFHVKSTGNSLDVYVNNSICVNSGGSVFVDGNLYCQDVDFTSDGQVTINSSELVNVLLPSKFSGDGTLTFEGTGDFDVTSINDNFYVSNLTVNTEGIISLEKNFSVNQILKLSNGIVDVALPNVLYATSDDRDAILFDETDYDASYVIGYLGRNVATGNTYYYPIGEDAGAYPLSVTDAESADYLIARYDKSIGLDAENALSSSGSSVDMLSQSGWYVYGENVSANRFAIGLWAPEQFNASNNAGILYSEFSDFSDYSEVWSAENNYQSYLNTTGNVDLGYFALIEDGDEIPDDLRLRNCFLVGNGNTTIFEIPDASTYSSIKMSMYNDLGTRLFYADSYINQLDLSHYPTGTYYYELILEKGSKEKKIYNFIEVKNEDY